MDLEIIILSKPDKERQIPYSITYIWNLKYGTNELIHKIKIEPQTQKTIPEAELPRKGQIGLLKQ